jgi:hypothetical protein
MAWYVADALPSHPALTCHLLARRPPIRLLVLLRMRPKLHIGYKMSLMGFLSVIANHILKHVEDPIVALEHQRTEPSRGCCQIIKIFGHLIQARLFCHLRNSKVCIALV